MTPTELLASASARHAVFAGERIVDVYHYVRPLARPPKELILSVEKMATERFEGGIVAVAAHAANFCANVQHVFDRTITKERYIERAYNRKLFQVYTGMELHKVHHYSCPDVLAVVDYGHGMFAEPQQPVAFFALNVQTNSANYGFNLATRYTHADYLLVDENEARLATQNRSGDIEQSLLALGKIASKVVITLGVRGAIGLDGGDISRSDAHEIKVIDTLGAGDAFFAVTALIAEDADMPSILRIGQAAGGLKTQILGHQASVTKDALLEYLAKHP